MIEYPLDKKYSVQHELGGAPSWVLSKETYYNAKGRLVEEEDDDGNPVYFFDLWEPAAINGAAAPARYNIPPTCPGFIEKEMPRPLYNQ